MEIEAKEIITTTESNPVICPLCSRAILLELLCDHLELHEQAEMLADILALSRR